MTTSSVVRLPTIDDVPRPLANGYEVQIGQHLFQLAASRDAPLTSRSTETEQGVVRTEQSAEEYSDQVGRTFARSDFDGGEGLAYAHTIDSEPGDVSRFWSSRNVEVLMGRGGAQSRIVLAKQMEIVTSYSTVDPYVPRPMVTLDSGLVATVDWNPTPSQWEVEVIPDPQLAGPIPTSEDPHAGESPATFIYSLATDGNKVYAALGQNGIHIRSEAGVWSHWSDLPATGVWWVKGRLMAAVGPLLYEVASDASSEALVLSAPENIHTVGDGGSHMLVTADEIYALNSAGGLEVTAQSRIANEEPLAVDTSQGLVFFTSREPTAVGGYVGRLWKAELTDAGAIANAQVLREWGDESTSIDASPHQIELTRDAAYVAVREYGSEAHVWRYDFVTGGMFRHRRIGITDADRSPASGLTFVGDRLIVSWYALWREATTYESSGWLIGPLGDHFYSPKKQWVSGRLFTDEIKSGAVSLQYTTNPEAINDPAHTSWKGATVANSGTGGNETAISGEGRWIAGKVTITAPSSLASTPKVKGYSFRSIPLANRIEALIPLNVSDSLEHPHRKPVTIPGLGDAVAAHLMALTGELVRIDVLRPDRKERFEGLLLDVSAPTAYVTPRGSRSLFAQIRVLGEQSVVPSGVATLDALGVGNLGV